MKSRRSPKIIDQKAWLGTSSAESAGIFATMANAAAMHAPSETRSTAAKSAFFSGTEKAMEVNRFSAESGDASGDPQFLGRYFTPGRRSKSLS